MVFELMVFVGSSSSCEEDEDQKDRDGCVVGWCESDGYDGVESLKLLLVKLQLCRLALLSLLVPAVRGGVIEARRRR